MDNMHRITIGALNEAAIKAISGFLKNGPAGSSSGDNVGAVLESLKQKGFTGCGECLELENGYFFPQSSLKKKNLDDVFVVTSKEVQWVNGGPGLLLQSTGTEINQFCDVGVFIGHYPKASESINVG